MNRNESADREFNVYPIIRDALLIVMFTLLVLSLVETKSNTFQLICWLALAIVCSVLGYLYVLVLMWNRVLRPLRILLVLAEALLSLTVILAGLARVFYSTRPGALSVMPVSEYVRGFSLPGLSYLVVVVGTALAFECTKVAPILSPIRTRKGEWCLIVGLTVVLTAVSHSVICRS